VQVLAEKKPP